MISLVLALEPSAYSGEMLRFVLSKTALPDPLLSSPDGAAAAHLAPLEYGSAPLALLPRSDEVVAVLPAIRLSWHHVVLPRVPAARMRTALEGLLERLLQDARELHFALAPRAVPGSPAWVCVCNKAWLQTALLAFSEAGRPVTRIVPEHLPVLEGAEAQLHFFGDTELVWLVRRASDGVQALPLTRQGSREAMDMALGNADDIGHVSAEPQVAQIAEQFFEKVELRPWAEGLVAAARSHWNVAQFELSSSGRGRALHRVAKTWSQWSKSPVTRAARWGAAALVLIQVVGMNAAAWKERTELQARQAEVKRLLTDTFPNVSAVVDAPVQLTKELALLRHATGTPVGSDLEPALLAVAQRSPPGIRPTAIEYAEGELRLKGYQPSAMLASQLQLQLQADGYASKVENGTWVLTAQGAQRGQGNSPSEAALKQ